LTPKLLNIDKEEQDIEYSAYRRTRAGGVRHPGVDRPTDSKYPDWPGVDPCRVICSPPKRAQHRRQHLKTCLLLIFGPSAKNQQQAYALLVSRKGIFPCNGRKAA